MKKAYMLLPLCHLIMSLNARAEEPCPERTPKAIWGLTAEFDLNIPGDWRSTDTSQETLVGYGGRIGGGMALRWPKGWQLETALTVGYDRLPLPTYPHQTFTADLDRWSLSIPITAGYIFDATEEMGIGPVAGVDFSWSFADRLHSSTTFPTSGDPLWNPFSICWGFGCAMRFKQYEVTVTGWFGTIDIIRRNPLSLPPHCYPNNVRIGLKYFL